MAVSGVENGWGVSCFGLKKDTASSFVGKLLYTAPEKPST
jgi:hypothetical protein